MAEPATRVRAGGCGNINAKARNLPAQRPAEVWACATCGNGLSGACDVPTRSCRIDPEFVVWRLEQAGATLLAMRDRTVYPAGARCAWPEVLHEAVEAYGWSGEILRPAIPDAPAISRMDRTYGWLQHIPQDKFLIRRLVAIRSLVNPFTGRHLYSWRRLGGIVRAEYHAIQLWHSTGIVAICEKLRG